MENKNHYVNNAEFVKALTEYKTKLQSDPSTPIPEYIGHCLLEIATRFASKSNFYGYSFKDEMISDAIENCLQYLTNFDESKSKNAFSYFTQITFYAFLRRIMREKKQSYIKHQLIKDMPFDSFDIQDHDDADFASKFSSFVQANNSFDGEAFERKLEKKAKKAKKEKTSLNDFMEGDNEV